MTDRELLELAAKAAGIDGRIRAVVTGLQHDLIVDENDKEWNPLTDDGDALRLAVKLGVSIVPYPIYQPEKHSVTTKQRRISDTMRKPNPTETIELYGSDKDAATRRAIVRAAAAIGETLP